MLAAGAIASELRKVIRDVEMDEEAWSAYLAWRGVAAERVNLPRLIEKVGECGKNLARLGYSKDIPPALSLNTVAVVPKLVDRYLVDAYLCKSTAPQHQGG